MKFKLAESDPGHLLYHVKFNILDRIKFRLAAIVKLVRSIRISSNMVSYTTFHSRGQFAPLEPLAF
jgi:hypothetical protein